MPLLKLPSNLSASFSLNTLSVLPALFVLSLGATAAHADAYTPTNANVAPEPSTAKQTVSDKKGIQAGLNVIVTGSPYDIDTSVAVLPSLFYDNGKAYVRGSQLGGYLINNPQNEVAGFLQPAGYSFDPDDANGALRGLDEREWSAMLGVSYLRRTPIGGFRAQIATDVLGNSEGTLAKLAYLARIQKNDWTIYPSIGIEWANDDYNNYYYGVSDEESLRTGVQAYKADSSISPYVNVNANYDINQDWALFLGQSVSYLGDEQKDSPMVDNRTTYRTTLGVLYKF